MDIRELQKTLQKSHEPKGYFLNHNQEQVTALLQGLLTNTERYGYMSSPCRLASDSHTQDRDIICPCFYREADVREYGSCYCGFYVSKGLNTGERGLFPERRPPAANR